MLAFLQQCSVVFGRHFFESLSRAVLLLLWLADGLGIMGVTRLLVPYRLCGWWSGGERWQMHALCTDSACNEGDCLATRVAVMSTLVVCAASTHCVQSLAV